MATVEVKFLCDSTKAVIPCNFIKDFEERPPSKDERRYAFWSPDDTETPASLREKLGSIPVVDEQVKSKLLRQPQAGYYRAVIIKINNSELENEAESTTRVKKRKLLDEDAIESSKKSVLENGIKKEILDEDDESNEADMATPPPSNENSISESDHDADSSGELKHQMQRLKTKYTSLKKKYTSAKEEIGKLLSYNLKLQDMLFKKYPDQVTTDDKGRTEIKRVPSPLDNEINPVQVVSSVYDIPETPPARNSVPAGTYAFVDVSDRCSDLVPASKVSPSAAKKFTVMEKVTEFFKSVFPSLKTELSDKIFEALQNEGFDDFNSLRYLDPEKDLAGVLKTAQLRKLKEHIDNYFKTAVESKSNFPVLAELLESSPGCSKDMDFNSEEPADVMDSAPNHFDVDTFIIPYDHIPPQALNAWQENKSLESLEDSRSTPDEFVAEARRTRAPFDPDAYVIPYADFPPQALRAFNEDKPMEPVVRRQVVRIICSDILQKTDKPLKRDLEPIAKAIVAKHKSFEDKVDGKRFGLGYESLLHQLISRCDNCRRNRASPASYAPKSVSFGLSDARREKLLQSKKQLLEQHGCSNWDICRIKSLMDETYSLQREDVNLNMSFEKVKGEWPFLTVGMFFYDHFERLMGFRIEERLDNSVAKMVPELKRYFKHCRVESLSNGPDFHYDFVILLAKYFKEDATRMIRIYEASQNVTDVLKTDIPVEPLICCFGSPYEKSSNCLLLCERIAFSHMVTLRHAICLWFGCYFTLNVQYPEACCATMEYIQRVFLDINDRSSVKQRKRFGRVTGKHPKVLKLIRDLEYFKEL